MRRIDMRGVVGGVLAAFLVVILLGLDQDAFGQSPSVTSSGGPGVSARPVTIPLTIRVKGTPRELELQAVDLAVTEDGDPQTILSIRAMGSNSPLNLIVLI